MRPTRVAAITGSTRTSSVGSTSCSQCSSGSRSSSANTRVSWSIGSAAYVRRWKRVITPKNAGPEPRAAQNRSAFSVSEAWISSPPGVTTSIPTTFSQPQPQRRLFQPWPPCSRKPPRPTDSQCPPVNMRPCGSRNGVSSIPPLIAGLASAIPSA